MFAYNTISEKSTRIIIACVLMALVLFIFGMAIDCMWFREDDLGTILNGIVRSWSDFYRVLFADCRSFITADNYQRSAPNVISAFWRPMQNFVFSLVHAVNGINPYVLYMVHVAIHACNAALVFYICSLWCPLWISTISGLLFAFYPDMSWLTWIATLQNSLATFFMCFTIILFYHFVVLRNGIANSRWYGLFSGLSFFFSLLSRENGLLIPFWLALFTYVEFTSPGQKFSQRIKLALRSTAMLWIVLLLYTLIRCCTFGAGSLPRSYRNMFIRMPILTKIIPEQLQPRSLHQTRNLRPAPQTNHNQPAHLEQPEPAQPKLRNKIASMIHTLRTWEQPLLGVWAYNYTNDVLFFMLCMLILLFLLYAFHGRMQLFMLIFAGFACMLWPGLLTYTCSRYLSMMYPFFIIMLAVALHYTIKNNRPRAHLIAALVCAYACFAIVSGIWFNMHMLKKSGMTTCAVKQRFDTFFSTVALPTDAKVIVLGAPFLSDIQSVFHYYLANPNIKVAHEWFTTLAEEGNMGCQLPYRINNVKTTIKPINGGLRFISHDVEHAGWWIHFSHHPLAWNNQVKSYEWTNQPYLTGRWYPCSLGRFKINAQQNKVITDLSLIINQKWIDEHTVFVTWDTEKGVFTTLNASLLTRKKGSLKPRPLLNPSLFT